MQTHNRQQEPWIWKPGLSPIMPTSRIQTVKSRRMFASRRFAIELYTDFIETFTSQAL
jgi:hypothetical protein